MLDSINVGAHRQFATAFSVYQAATGEGSIKDLFKDKPQDAAGEDPPPSEHAAAVQHAQQVMDEQTTQLDSHRSKS